MAVEHRTWSLLRTISKIEVKSWSGKHPLQDYGVAMKKAIALSISTFFLGVAMVVAIPSCRKFIRLKRYTANYSASQFQNWDKESLVLNSDGKPFSEFINENDRFVIFFWATWCPYCKEAMGANKILAERNVAIIGLPYDRDAEYFNWFIDRHKLSWDNLLRQTSLGKTSFIQRKGYFYFPLIPSWLLIENGAVSDIFVGNQGKEKVLAYFTEDAL